MVDYYKVLGVKRNATQADIKSAYRRRARERHPDLNADAETRGGVGREFALLSRAYRTLGDPQSRAKYDERLLRATLNRNSASILDSSNAHARRLRRLAAQARWDKRVDDWIETERRETYARMQAVFTTVTLFLSTFIVASLKPRLWQNSESTGRAIIFTLFLVGVWHIFSRLRAAYANYTYQPKPIHDSLMGGEEKPDKPFTRFSASLFLIVGYLVSLAAGLFVGGHIYYIVSDMARYFDAHVSLSLIFYPPIAVLIVDLTHAVLSKIE